MGSIFQDRRSGIWQAPDWTSRSGRHLPQHSLGTRDPKEADEIWSLEKARLVRPVAASEGAFRPKAQLQLVAETFETALAGYVLTKRKWKTATREKARYAIEGLLDARFRLSDDGPATSLRNLKISEFAGVQGGDLLTRWIDADIARHRGRTHTTVKVVANFIKPALEYADKRGWFGDARFPIFPEIGSDYKRAGARKRWLPRAEFLRLAAELLPRDVIFPMDGGPPQTVYPRLCALIEASTGMHASNTDHFSEADYDPVGGRWYRQNNKGEDHCPPEWFPARHFLRAALEHARARWAPHYCARVDGWDRTVTPPRCAHCGHVARIWVSDGGPPRNVDWMGSRLRSAAKRARMPHVARIDFRRTFATWALAEGWSFDYTAHWLGNSSGMVREVYAQLQNEQFKSLVARSELVESELIGMLPLGSLGPRRGPKNRARVLLVRSPSETPSERTNLHVANTGYQKKGG